MRLDLLERSVVVLVLGAAGDPVGVNDLESCPVVELLLDTRRVCRLGEALLIEGFREGGLSFGGG